ncbi:SDR family NAD(P)-dependent oxidoreductase [Pseudovibrio denitrificans]|uniref:SDR family NAD(P)-dependent oxidoreductase n=1 Tax=Pseudovibrio denitrificans TaxID=258256 RepID=UPI000B0448D9|nr:SDR family oxidoreductase [Pseudovibrio denitrificans]
MGKVALITGASSGIGRELARLHAEKGGDVILVARRGEVLRQLKDELETAWGVQAQVIEADLVDEKAPRMIFEAVEASGWEVEYLINNAGFGGRGKFHERDWQDERDMMQVNVVSLTALTHLFLPQMVARNSGRILNVSSTASLLPGPMKAVYYASKAFVTSFSNAIAEELHDTRVTVTALLPGATDTEFAARSGMDKTRLFDNAASARSVALDGYQP